MPTDKPPCGRDPETCPHRDGMFHGCQEVCEPPSLTRPQDAPIRNTGAPSAHDLVMDDMRDRRAFGLEKYGTLLQFDNGRDHLTDAYQESLDLVVYLRNEIEWRKRYARMEQAALALYRAGFWDLVPRHGEPSLPAPEQAKLWEALRDALGLPPGTATAAGDGSVY